MKKSNGGIEFDSIIHLSEEEARKFPAYMKALQLLAIYMGSYCFMTIFKHSFELQVVSSQLLLAIIIIGSIYYLILLYPVYDLLKFIILIGTYIATIYYKLEQLKNGIFILENAFIKTASNYYGFPRFSFIADYSVADKDTTLLLIMIMIPVLAILSISLVRSKLKIICYIIMIIPVALCFAMGVTPPEGDLIVYILVLLFISISNGFSHAKHPIHKGSIGMKKSMIYRISIRSAYILCLLALLLFFLIKQFVPVEKYNDYNQIHETKIKVQDYMTNISIQGISDKLSNAKWKIHPSRIESSGGLGLGELGRVDQVVYDETEHLQVIAPLRSVMEGIYLKGYIGSVYTGDSWDIHSRDIIENYNKMIAKILLKEFEPALGSVEILSQYPIRSILSQGRIEITYVDANKKYVYAPYFTLFTDKDEVYFEYDLATISGQKMKVGTYDYSYIINDTRTYNDGLILINSDMLSSENEKIYREFVYETYTKLPEDGLDRLKQDFSREQIGKQAENLPDAISYVKNYLDRFTRYTLSPGRLPRNEDFVEYFLYDNKIGYCTHFASAGALMLRAMGYPTRYVEGYAINSSDILEPILKSYIDGKTSNAEITVKDYNAHAWVEVYYDGLGWIPVEFTTGSGMDDLVDNLAVTSPLDQVTVDEEPTNSPTEAPPTPTIMPEEESKPSPPASGQDEDIHGSGLLDEEDDKSSVGLRWYMVLIIIVILSTAIILFRTYILRKRDEIGNESYSNRALRLYIRIEQLFILDKGLPSKSKCLEESEEYIKKNYTMIPIEEFDRCMDVVRKARFSKESISPREYMIVKKFYKTLANRIYERVHPIKKILFKIII